MGRPAEKPIHSLVTSSPISIALPAGQEPPMVLDMGGGIMGFNQEHFAGNPAPFFKALGLSTIIQVLGGVFAGIYRDEFCPPNSKWESNQGSFIVAVDPAHFWPLDEFKREMDGFIGQARRMEPMPGLDRAELAGGFEHQWAAENREKGIPLGPEHQRQLEEAAAARKVAAPFAAWEHTRFG